MNKPERVVLHCAATPDYPTDQPLPYDYGAADIDAWHRKRGWTEIGYHAVIKRDGTIEFGTREENEYGAHVRGHNVNSLGICYIGTKRPTIRQIDSIIAMFLHYKQKYGIGHDKWFGHYEFDENKECPGFSMELMRYLLKSHDKNGSEVVA